MYLKSPHDQSTGKEIWASGETVEIREFTTKESTRASINIYFVAVW